MEYVGSRDYEFDGRDRSDQRFRKSKKRSSDNYEGSVPIARPGSNQFVAQTWRFFFYALFLAGAGASLAFLTPLPFVLLPTALVAMFISLFTFILLHYAFENYSGAFYAFLFFAATLGIVLGPQLVLIAATVTNGMFIICAAAAATLGMTLMLHNYAWFKATFSLHRISLLGSFLSTALTGLLIIGLISLIFPTPIGMLLYGAAGVAVFSLYLVYDVYLLKIGAFKSPVEAAMNLFLDVINLFLEMLRIFIAIQTEKNEIGNFGNFFLTRILPLIGIALIVCSFGLLEGWIMKGWHGIDDDEQSALDMEAYNTPPSRSPEGSPVLQRQNASAPVLHQDQQNHGQGPNDGPGFGGGRTQSAPPQGQAYNQGGQTFFVPAQQGAQNGSPEPTAPPLHPTAATAGFPQYQQVPGGYPAPPQNYYNSPTSFTGNMSGSQQVYPDLYAQVGQKPPAHNPDAFGNGSGGPVYYQ